MRATLFHNANAGFDDYTPESLLELLESKGYEAHQAESHDPAAAKHDLGDVVVVAGGDGTVGEIVKEYVGMDVIFGLLPLGTANNVATSLHITGKPKEIISRWDPKQVKDFDIGVATVQGKDTYFLESVGFGLFPRLMRVRKDISPQPTRYHELKDGLAHQLEVLKEYEAHECTIRTDDETITGKYLMIEIMNTALAGSNMCLAPDADSGDGLLDVVLVHENERDIFGEFLKDSLEEKWKLHPLKVRRTKQISASWKGNYFHIDDKTIQAAQPIEVTVSTLPSAVRFLKA